MTRGYNGGGHAFPPYLPPPLNFADPYGSYPPPPYAYTRRRSPPPPHRRLSDRLSEAPLPNVGRIEGLPAKPIGTPLGDSPGGGRRGGAGNGGGGGNGGARGVAVKPPANAKEDPRATLGKKVSYHDMDEVAEGDIELSY